MPAAKDDDTTNIEGLVEKFAKDISARATALLKDAAEAEAKKAAKDGKGGAEKKKGRGDEPATIVFSLDPNAATKARTPAEQAEQVAAGRSWVCWGAHMADKARHVIMKVDGKVSFDAAKTFGTAFAGFKSEWATAMKGAGLKNANGKDGWYDGDSFHLEMEDSKIARTDERVSACFEEYVNLSRGKGGKPNGKFEKTYAKDLKSLIERYEKANKK